MTMQNVKLTEYIPELDDYEMKPHYDFDYRKSRPNPFVTRGDSTRRVKKQGSTNGKATPPPRKLKTPTTKRHTITLEQADAAYLYKLDKSLSHAIRKLILRQRKVS